MALTSEDLNSIRSIVKEENSMQREELQESMDRMESRLTTAMGLIQRDSFSRLDDHEARIRRLEQASSRS